ncbi:TetR/AcrR family transcriptional regulator [Arthrobacter mobilis]|uniref:TetR/AcrR family transcriptional regulator n=1 Tax=Arthrobacter mobilis TaxID=2724944 RepID=A0A7X6K7J6_9MICC|nr:TetR/AcrR family transcriptional regulator [Arthrobacter mobilis]NKX56579.1 TetR/AcrR family transcriptional regulator [Arthrobacter mobilis]
MTTLQGRQRTRSGRADTLDPRSLATRRKLAAALLAAARDEGLQTVSASGLAREAGLSRSGFYEHFANVDELAFFVLDDLLADIGALDLEARRKEGVDGRAVGEWALELLLDRILEHQNFYTHLLVAGGFPGAAGRIIEKFAEHQQPGVRLEKPEWTESRIDLVTESVAGMLVSGIRYWLRTGAQESPREFAQELMQIVPGWLYRMPREDPTAPLRAGLP